MKCIGIFLIFLFISSLVYVEAGASLEWRQYYQDGNQYVIEVYSTQVCTLEFFWKEQEAQQGSYQLIATLQKPNEGNLYRALWNISAINDGNYTVMVRSSCGSEIEQNVLVNKAHWDISPVNVQYLGWIDAKYVGSIEGTVTTVPVGGTLSFYAQYFLFTKQSDNTFRVESLQIPNDVLKLIYKELYSKGAKWGTLHYQINDDKLEVRVIFPGYASYRPYSEPEETEPEQTQQEQTQQNSQELQQILSQLSEIKNQNQNLNQEIVNLNSKLSEKDQTISDLDGEIKNVRDQLKENQEKQEVKREEENQQLLIYVVIIVAAGIGAGYYALSKRQSNMISSPRQSKPQFMQGRPFNSQSSVQQEEKIPMSVHLAAFHNDYDPITLHNLVKEKKAEKPHLSTERALNEVLNQLRGEGELQDAQ